MLHTMLSLLMSLREDFESCLQLSPVVLTEHKFEFARLASQLNMFFERAKLSTPDPSHAVNTDELINHFTQGKNRSMLLTGLEQLAEFIQNYQDLSKMCVSAKCI
ncbi:unnamed protein product [Lymnaea stagnalis]|uniref:Uncharacterized protein n=1 Tax=Lymnaea stagnalis TaxID=6523 RepID=A0AAV2H9Z0_LYMST